MNGNDLAKMFEFSYAALNRNLDGVTHDESLHAPEPGGNCLNWVLGHVVVSRNLILTLAGATPVMTGEKVAVYQRGSMPSKAEEHVDIATLRSLFDDSQRQLIPALSGMTEEALAHGIPEQFRRPPLTGSIVDGLTRLHYHEGYHNGQIGLLRRVAGKQGAIR